MQQYDDASFLDSESRLHEIASILAVGILRLRARAALPSPDPGRKNLEKSVPDGLEVPGPTVLSGHTS